MSRRKLVGLLWPDIPEDTARNRLNTHLHAVRRRLGPEILQSVGMDLRLSQEAVDCDVCRFDAAMAGGEYDTAVSLYEGPFLDGFSLEGCRPFEDFADRQAARLRRDLCRALVALADAAREEGSLEEAVGWWWRLVGEDPYNGKWVLQLMEALTAGGNPMSALRAAEAYARRIRQDLNAAPDEQVMALAKELAGSTGRSSDVWTRFDDSGRTPSPESRSIAILPFEDLGRGDEATTLAKGLHAELLTRLAEVAGLRVISRASVLRIADSGEPISQIGRLLGIGSLVEGGVQQVGDRLRLNVQLVDIRSDTHLWAQTFDREITALDLFEMQRELSEKIVANLSIRLSSGERARLRLQPTESTAAYRLCLRGRVLLELRTGRQMDRAVEWFRQATAEDPNYAGAWSGLANALLMLREYGYPISDESLHDARLAVRRAGRLDPESREVHANLGLLHAASGHGWELISALRRAVELSPSYAEAHSLMSWYLPLLGRPREGWEHAVRAADLDPLSHEALANVSYCHLSLGEARKALAPARRSRELQPDYPTAPFYEALALYHLGDFDGTTAILRGLELDWAPLAPRAVVALIRAAAGSPEPARELLRRSKKEVDEVSLFYRGLLLAALDDNDQALAHFEAIEGWGGSPLLAFANRSLRYLFPQLLRPLRNASRFGGILRAIDRAWGMPRRRTPGGGEPPLRRG